MNAEAWMQAHSLELAEFEVSTNDIPFSAMSISTEFGEIEYVDTLVDESAENFEEFLDAVDLANWEDDDAPIDPPEEPESKDDWDFL